MDNSNKEARERANEEMRLDYYREHLAGQERWTLVQFAYWLQDSTVLQILEMDPEGKSIRGRDHMPGHPLVEEMEKAIVAGTLKAESFVTPEGVTKTFLRKDEALSWAMATGKPVPSELREGVHESKDEPVGLPLPTTDRLTKDAERGQKTLKAARKGHEKVHGTKKDKEARWARCREAYNEVKANNPLLSRTEACKRAAAKLCCSYKTVERAMKKTGQNPGHCPDCPS